MRGYEDIKNPADRWYGDRRVKHLRKPMLVYLLFFKIELAFHP
jgi:hypothetical protein